MASFGVRIGVVEIEIIFWIIHGYGEFSTEKQPEVDFLKEIFHAPKRVDSAGKKDRDKD
ncbi:MAG TPA: hypothetical protein PK821_04420 [Victivallales bacterium]|nr:hypothetical protein [Victivallales bacterium]